MLTRTDVQFQQKLERVQCSLMSAWPGTEVDYVTLTSFTHAHTPPGDGRCSIAALHPTKRACIALHRKCMRLQCNARNAATTGSQQESAVGKGNSRPLEIQDFESLSDWRGKCHLVPGGGLIKRRGRRERGERNRPGVCSLDFFGVLSVALRLKLKKRGTLPIDRDQPCAFRLDPIADRRYGPPAFSWTAAHRAWPGRQLPFGLRTGRILSGMGE
jgi:hypothetical protein